MRCIKSFRVDIPINEYIRRCEKQIVDWEDQEKELLNNSQLEHTKSVEYASRIILGMVTGSKDLIYGNVLNQNFIPNLPHNSCVEVPCIVQKNEIIPQTVTPLPFTANGISAPTTWDEFLAACATLKAAGVTPITIGSKYLWTTAGVFDYLNLRTNGYEFHMALTKGEVSWTDDRVRATMTNWKQLIDAGFFLENKSL